MIPGSLRAGSYTRVAFVRALDAWVLHQAAVPHTSAAFEVSEERRPSDGVGDTGNVELHDGDGLEARVATLGRRVVEYAAIDSEPATFECDRNVGG
ncbi:hypothetical protein ACFR97_17465 [Haloplanus litoreus]|uniref:Uncharacterized protein n=1 Tax=Haloplanus litoreus TaxID=767515 RepID=A0ABD5ZXP2_9EURY